MDDLEKLELVKAALAVAAADGEIRRSEMGVVMGLAARVGSGPASGSRATRSNPFTRPASPGPTPFGNDVKVPVSKPGEECPWLRNHGHSSPGLFLRDRGNQA